MAFLRNKRNFLLLSVAKREKLDLLSLAGPLKTIQATLKSVIKKNSQNILSRMVSPNLLNCHIEQPHSLNSLTNLQMRLKFLSIAKWKRELYPELSQTFKMEIFCKNSQSTVFSW